MVPSPILLTALVYSFILSLLAMGFTLQYITLSVPNLAYATIAFASTYLTLTFSLMNLSPYVAMPFGFLLGGAISFMLYKFVAFLRNRGTSIVGLMMATIVFDLIIYASMNIYADYLAYVFKLYAGSFSLSEFDFEIFSFPAVLFISGLTSVGLVAFFTLMLVKTKFGVAMRAVMENFNLASVHGINTERILSIAWFFVGGTAGLSGSLYPIWFAMDPWVGARMFISIFAACVIGGLRSIYGSLLGGFIIAFSEVVVTYFLSLYFPWIWAYRAVTSMVIAAFALVEMPSGIAGLIEKLRRG
ncbi:MAG: branched-chain amino acid ABC transporter permease [Nitrososphaeria archaeon]|nr:branched-chain amino acid ABC transporter permease [Nitrososphaeria archaeon]